MLLLKLFWVRIALLWNRIEAAFIERERRRIDRIDQRLREGRRISWLDRFWLERRSRKRSDD
jgi:hypothetical protein